MYYFKRTHVWLFAFALVICLHFPQLAQAQSIGTLPIGVQGGINLANFGGDANTDVRLGLHLGANTLYELNEQFIWEPGIQLSLVGGKGTNTVQRFEGFQLVEESEDYKINQWYINVPLPVRYELQEGIIVKGGPYIGFLVGSKYKEGDNSMDSKSSYKGMDMGLLLGVAYPIQEDIEVGAGYNLGIMNVADTNISGFNVSNQVFQLTVRYTLSTGETSVN